VYTFQCSTNEGMMKLSFEAVTQSPLTLGQMRKECIKMRDRDRSNETEQM